MSLQGPIIVAADTPAPGIIDCLAAAGAFPIVEARRKEVPAAIASVQPAAIILADPEPAWDRKLVKALEKAVAASDAPWLAVIACLADGAACEISSALRIPSG